MRSPENISDKTQLSTENYHLDNSVSSSEAVFQVTSDGTPVTIREDIVLESTYPDYDATRDDVIEFNERYST